MRPLSKWHAFPALLALAGCAQPAETDPIYSRSPVAEATAESLEKWNVAYAWGDHAQAGYLTEESDPGFTRSPAATVTADDLVNWRSAHGWGNHAQAGYLTEELDPSF